jgi:tRNA-Thr(GGU) m(6)t(6)A37 methyltransferase TsaA
MKNNEFIVRSIGVIHTPHTVPSQTPIQPVFAKGIRGTVEVFHEYVDGLMDLEAFSHVCLLYYFDRSTDTNLKVKPYLEDKKHGIFATRAPQRPNKLGISVVRLLSIERNILSIEDCDILDGTPLLDIKPYIERFDARSNVRSGWQENIPDDVADLRGRRGKQV